MGGLRPRRSATQEGTLQAQVGSLEGILYSLANGKPCFGLNAGLPKKSPAVTGSSIWVPATGQRASFAEPE